MAVNSLSLLESFRPWRNAGVLHFLADVLGNDDAAALHAASVSLQTGDLSIQQDAPPLAGHHESSRQAAQRDARAGSTPDEATFSGQGGRRVESQSAFADKNDLAPRAPEPAFTSLAGQAPWPPEWQALFARTRPAPLLWTYAELGFDLTRPEHPGRAERSALLKECISRLRLPKGTSMFWPVTLPQEDCAEGTSAGKTPPAAAPGSYFLAGVERFKPTVAVLVGPEIACTSGAGLSIASPFMQEIAGGVLYVLLPDFASLTTDAEAFAKACVFLRTALAGIAALSSSS